MLRNITLFGYETNHNHNNRLGNDRGKENIMKERTAETNESKINMWLTKALNRLIAEGDFVFYDFGVRAMTDPTAIAAESIVKELGLEPPKRYAVGDTVDFNSFVWAEEDPTGGEERGGVSAYGLDIEDLERSIGIASEEVGSWWGGEQLVLIVGERTGVGLEVGEVIINNGKVVEVLDFGE